MDVERSLLSKIVSTGQVEQAISDGIEVDHFLKEENQEVYDYLVKHLKKFKVPPTTEAFEDDQPDFDLVIVDDSLDYLLEKFKSKVKRRFAIDKIRDLSEEIDDSTSHADIDLKFFEAARDLALISPTTKAGLYSQMGERITEYEKRLAEGEEKGIPYGLPTIDEMTGGIRDHELVIVAGWQNVGKSTAMNIFALNAYMAGFTPMIFSLEMKRDAIYRRFDSMSTGLSYQRLKALNLSDGEIKEWQKAAKTASKAENDIIVSDDIGRVTVDKVIAETVKYKPDLVIIDYLSLLETPRSMGQSWESIKFLTRELKLAALTLETPIMAAAQTNRSSAEDGAKLENLSFGPTIGMDADVVLGLFQDDEMREGKEMQVRLSKNRDGPRGEIQMTWDYETMEFQELGFKEMWKKRKKQVNDAKDE